MAKILATLLISFKVDFPIELEHRSNRPFEGLRPDALVTTCIHVGESVWWV